MFRSTRVQGALILLGVSVIATAAFLYFTGTFGSAAATKNSDGHSHSHSGPNQYVGTELDGPAPAITLTDQRGDLVSLADLAGSAVILTFMDTRCTNTCPLTALEFRTLYTNLGAAADNVTFVGVNVNRNYNDIEDTKAFTLRYRLDEIPNWHLLTGTEQELRPVWSRYNIQVEPIPGSDEYSHTPGDYIIDSSGELRWYVSVPLVEDLLIADWDGPRLSDILLDRINELMAEAP